MKDLSHKTLKIVYDKTKHMKVVRTDEKKTVNNVIKIIFNTELVSVAKVICGRDNLREN